MKQAQDPHQRKQTSTAESSHLRKRPWEVDRCIELWKQHIAGQIDLQEMQRQLKHVRTGQQEFTTV
jgi:hypothetical protein